MKRSKQITVSQSLVTAMANQGIEQILAESPKFQEREQMENSALAKEAHEAEMLAASARLHLWARMTLRFQNN